MKEEKERNYSVFRHLGLATQLGTTLLVSLLLGIFIGIYLDRCFDTMPLFTIGVGFFGIYSGLRTVVQMCSPPGDEKKEEKEEEISNC